MNPRAEVLARALIDSGLSEIDLWLRYFALGGQQTPTQMHETLVGRDAFDDHQLETLVHALNERFAELSLNHPVPYPV